MLVPFDDSPPARSALEYAFELFPDADVTALAIVEESTIDYAPAPPTERGGDGASELLEARPRELASAIELAERVDGELRTAGRVGTPTRGILEYLESGSVDHVVIGSHCRSGLDRVLRGSVAEVVVRHSPVPVTVVRAGPDRGD
ncbi:universal stress protein [Halopiger goleimassiliensis]|uniref:universal stress protein n=1 Tax=Halopiger goleimassiliensis TaxID=1293048 RepID=UPI000677C62D